MDTSRKNGEVPQNDGEKDDGKKEVEEGKRIPQNRSMTKSYGSITKRVLNI